MNKKKRKLRPQPVAHDPFKFGEVHKKYIRKKYGIKEPKVKKILKYKNGGYTVTNRFSDRMLPEKKRTTRIT